MKTTPQIIVMLTYNDLTVENAFEVFEQCKNSKAGIFGFKEEPLSLHKMKELFSYMKANGKKTALEVVAYTEEECLYGVKTALECGCDYLMGTAFFDSVNDFCKENNIKYFPYVGDVKQRPSVLNGNIDDIINEAQEYKEKGVFGFDLLGYRYTGDSFELNKKFVESIDLPICIAGSVDSFLRLDELKEIAPWGFTIGSAFFDNAFGDTFEEQINKVFDYINED